MARFRTITHTSYQIEIVSMKSTRAITRQDGRRFTRKIGEAIGALILKTARAAVNENIKAGKLSKRFSVTMDS